MVKIKYSTLLMKFDFLCNVTLSFVDFPKHVPTLE
jgi:hypothetical protein